MILPREKHAQRLDRKKITAIANGMPSSETPVAAKMSTAESLVGRTFAMAQIHGRGVRELAPEEP
jgi:hypothetical protein